MKKTLVAALVGLFGLIASGQSAQAVDATACPNSSMRVIVLGDSLADGLWASLTRFYAQCDTMKVVRLTAVSDGLAKTSDQEWIQRYLRSAGQPEDPLRDVVVVQMGANDITYIRNGRSREGFGTETWQALYTQRVAEITRQLSARSAGVFW